MSVNIKKLVRNFEIRRELLLFLYRCVDYSYHFIYFIPGGSMRQLFLRASMSPCPTCWGPGESEKHFLKNGEKIQPSDVLIYIPYIATYSSVLNKQGDVFINWYKFSFTSFLRNVPGTMSIELSGLKPATKYEMKTYHHSASYPNGGVEFTLQYDGNPINRYVDVKAHTVQ